LLIGDPSKSKKLGWEPKYDLAGLVKEMVASDLTLFKKDMLLMEPGHAVYVQQE
jgi:GDPmannose 4,6-dehydratase